MKEKSPCSKILKGFSICKYSAFTCMLTCRQLFSSSPHSVQYDCFLVLLQTKQSSAVSPITICKLKFCICVKHMSSLSSLTKNLKEGERWERDSKMNPNSIIYRPHFYVCVYLYATSRSSCCPPDKYPV